VTRKPRADAERNRAHVVRVAHAAYSAEGLGVTMREIARRARLGIATVHRHFPSREDLITAAFAEQVATCVATVELAAADPDPWRGLTTVLDEMCVRQALDHGFVAALLDRSVRVFARQRAANGAAIAGLLERAKAAGALRPDVGQADLRLVLVAAGAVAADRPSAPDGSRRLVRLLLAGMRSAGDR
jgi:AcrR family transcriptional regulator